MYVAIDVGGTKTLVVAYDHDGTELSRKKIPTSHDYGIFIKETTDLINELAGTHSIDVISMAAPGVVDYDTKVIREFGNINWHNADLITPFSTEFNAPVLIDNDANLGALGEANMGAGKGVDTMLYLTISTGIGSGITYKGALDKSLLKSEAGQMHFNHNGDLQVWEKFASGNAFVERFGGYGKDIDDPKIWKTYAYDLSVGFGSIMAIVQPDQIVIGGSMGEHLHKYHDFLVDAVGKVRSPLVSMPSIVSAAQPSFAVINGCYVAAKQQHEQK